MFWLKGCVNCGGDLFIDYGDWHCLQCGRYYYTIMPLGFPAPRSGRWCR